MKHNYVFKHSDGTRNEIEIDFEVSDADWKNITTDEFMSVDEIATDILAQWTDQTKKDFVKYSEDDLIQFHHGFGTNIRNTYGLWHPKNPFVVPDDLGDGHPDGLSHNVMLTMHRKLKQAGV